MSSDNAVVFWGREPPTCAGWWWHTFTVDPSDVAAIEVEEDDDGLYVECGRGEHVPVSVYGGRYSRWWPSQQFPPPWPENNP